MASVIVGMEKGAAAKFNKAGHDTRLSVGLEVGDGVQMEAFTGRGMIRRPLIGDADGDIAHIERERGKRKADGDAGGNEPGDAGQSGLLCRFQHGHHAPVHDDAQGYAALAQVGVDGGQSNGIHGHATPRLAREGRQGQVGYPEVDITSCHISTHLEQ